MFGFNISILTFVFCFFLNFSFSPFPTSYLLLCYIIFLVLYFNLSNVFSYIYLCIFNGFSRDYNIHTSLWTLYLKSIFYHFMWNVETSLLYKSLRPLLFVMLLTYFYMPFLWIFPQTVIIFILNQQKFQITQQEKDILFTQIFPISVVLSLFLMFQISFCYHLLSFSL